MRAWRKLRNTAPTVDTTLVTTAETVIASIGGVSTQSADGQVLISGLATITTGASTTAVVLRIRRGTDATGTVVGEAVSFPAAAATTLPYPYTAIDTPSEGTFNYVLTAQQTAASANGAAINASLTVQS